MVRVCSSYEWNYDWEKLENDDGRKREEGGNVNLFRPRDEKLKNGFSEEKRPFRFLYVFINLWTDFFTNLLI